MSNSLTKNRHLKKKVEKIDKNTKFTGCSIYLITYDMACWPQQIHFKEPNFRQMLTTVFIKFISWEQGKNSKTCREISKLAKKFIFKYFLHIFSSMACWKSASKINFKDPHFTQSLTGTMSRLISRENQKKFKIDGEIKRTNYEKVTVKR